jgi:hypothetical protein
VRNRLPLIVATLGVLVATGCTTTSEGTPLPGSTSTSASSDEPSSGDLPSDGAPKVNDPLDVSHFEKNPCDALTPENTQTLNLPPDGEQKGDSLGETCYWRNSQTRGTVGLHFTSGDKRGLSSLYREAKRDNFAYFEPIDDIEGHPAVAYFPDAKKPTITCVVAVGLSDQLMFAAQVDLSDANIGHKDPCEAAAQVAGMAMKTMREAA